MALTSGTKLGPYEIVAPLGAGAMGEVYRARDTKLGREVALKLLPPLFETDADRVARFTSEQSTVSKMPTTCRPWCSCWSRETLCTIECAGAPCHSRRLWTSRHRAPTRRSAPIGPGSSDALSGPP